MATASFTEYVEGYQGRYTAYVFQIGPEDDPVEYDPNTGVVTVPVYGNRDGDSAYIEDGQLTLREAGVGEIDSSGMPVPRGSFFSKLATLEGELSQSGDRTTLDLLFRADAWETNEAWSFTIPTPAPLSASDLSVDCAVDAATITAGDSVTVSATVTNPTDQQAAAEVTVSVGGSETVESVTLSAQATTSVETSIELSEPGEYEPSVAVSLL